jgi:hypothetical protein
LDILIEMGTDLKSVPIFLTNRGVAITLQSSSSLFVLFVNIDARP